MSEPSAGAGAAGDPPEQRRERLVEVYREASGCLKCQLSETRTKVVFGAGDANADLMFVGEAPGADEDRQGLPFVGRAGGLLNELLGNIGLERKHVFIANVLKCLRYNALVQLEDGNWERVGRLVSSRYSGKVMSVDEAGELLPRRVTGWHATPVGGRSVYKLSFRSARSAGPHRVAIELTGDHPVLTEYGYVPVEELRPGDRVSTGQGLSEMAFDVVCGTLLGDGSLNRASAYLAFGHSAKQRDYAKFKAVQLRELTTSMQDLEVAAVAGGPATYLVTQVRTRAHRALRILRSDFYRSEKVVPDWLPEAMNERMLAIWFLDDGHMRIRGGGRQPTAEVATNAFSDGDLQRLLSGLKRLGLPAKALRNRIFFDVPTSRLLSAKIARFVPPSMRYKLHPEVEAEVSFDPAAYERGPGRSLFDEVVVEDVTDKHRADTTFFCLDVEGTHNFVTAGGVVHNCRPPGNRDPQPVEIETCRPYLFSQVDLIQPRVVATLGNFATKLLTNNQTGITRVRGVPQVHTLGGRTVFVFPLLHPAAALRTPKMKETLAQDFERLSRLLEEPLPEPEEAPEARGEEPDPLGGAPAPASTPAKAPETDQLDIFRTG